MSENRKCWYCGSEPIVWHDDANLFAECPNEDCPNYGDNGFEALVLSVWNTRTIEDALQKRIDELEEELDCMHKRFRKPTHGSCCTCQRCGQFYDDCRCSLDDAADEIVELRTKIADLEKQLASYKKFCSAIMREE